jgi:catechol 2,3-dioxygenase-like lactoylglutathione lyase family enzyme
MEQRLTIITLGVNDLDTSIDFYENKFGWERSEMSNKDIVFYRQNGFYLSLYSRTELAKDASVSATGNGFNGFTLSYNTASKKEVDDLIHSLKSHGVRIVKEPEKVFWGGYSSYIADPDDNLWEIAFNPFLTE